MDQKHLAAEFVECLQERADASFGGKIHHAFVNWYVDAEFGEHAEWAFTDDARDGGVDAIILRPHDTPSLVILQSQFTARIGGAHI